jgi:hypothetical protein
MYAVTTPRQSLRHICKVYAPLFCKFLLLLYQQVFNILYAVNIR